MPDVNINIISIKMFVFSFYFTRTGLLSDLRICKFLISHGLVSADVARLTHWHGPDVTLPRLCSTSSSEYKQAVMCLQPPSCPPLHVHLAINTLPRLLPFPSNINQTSYGFFPSSVVSVIAGRTFPTNRCIPSSFNVAILNDST